MALVAVATARLTMYDGNHQPAINFTTVDSQSRTGDSGSNGAVAGKDGVVVAQLIAGATESVIGVGASSRPGRLVVFDGAGNGSIELSGATGDITLFNADCAKSSIAAGGSTCLEPGMVVSLEAQAQCVACDRPHPWVWGARSGPLASTDSTEDLAHERNWTPAPRQRGVDRAREPV